MEKWYPIMIWGRKREGFLPPVPTPKHDAWNGVESTENNRDLVARMDCPLFLMIFEAFLHNF
jgi:hypothetical protein